MNSSNKPSIQLSARNTQGIALLQTSATQTDTTDKSQRHPTQTMHQIAPQQLAALIPRPLVCWSCQDICTWLRLNEAQLELHSIRKAAVTGSVLRQLTPNDWVKFGASRYIARQIVQWIQEDAHEFEHHLAIGAQPEPDPKTQAAAEVSINKQLSKPKGQAESRPCSQQHQSVPISMPQRLLVRLSADEAIQKMQSVHPKSQSGEAAQSIEKQEISNAGEINPKAQRRSPKLISLAENNQGPTGMSLANKEKSCSDITQRVQKKIRQKRQPEMPENQREVTSAFTKGIKNIEKDEAKIIFFNENVSKNKQMVKNDDILHREPKIQNYMNKQCIEKVSEVVKNREKRVLTQEALPKKQISPTQKIQREIATRLKTVITPPIPSGQAQSCESKISSPHVKFTTSQFVPYTPVQIPINFVRCLKISTPNQQKVLPFIVRQNAQLIRIGRNKCNEINFPDQSISRLHAQISTKTDSQNNAKYFLRDVGSKFGTFVQCFGIQKDIIGESFLIGDSQVQILNVQAHKTTPITFTAKLLIDKQKPLTIAGRQIFTIPNPSERMIAGSCTEFKLSIKDHIIYLQAVQGKIYRKLREKKLLDIQELMCINGCSQKKVQIVFGWYMTVFQTIQLCEECSQQSQRCQCKLKGQKIDI